MHIPYETENFPPVRALSSGGLLSATWGDLLWAALTVGRPNVTHVFQHGAASVHEALFRLSLVRMALEQRSRLGRVFKRTSAFKSLDPTEKGAISYFLGMMVCKLFASRLLGTPWLLHLDVFREQLDPKVLAGRSRPDFVGQEDATGAWHSFESKGRSSPLGDPEKAKAKAQAQRLVSVDGSNCDLHIGALTFFHGDTLRFYWRDPEPTDQKSAINLVVPEDAWRDYYEPASALLRAAQIGSQSKDGQPYLAKIPEADISIGVHPELWPQFLNGDWSGVRDRARERRKDFEKAGYQPDGLIITCGESWQRPRIETEVG